MDILQTKCYLCTISTCQLLECSQCKKLMCFICAGKFNLNCSFCQGIITSKKHIYSTEEISQFAVDCYNNGKDITNKKTINKLKDENKELKKQIEELYSIQNGINFSDCEQELIRIGAIPKWEKINYLNIDSKCVD